MGRDSVPGVGCCKTLGYYDTRLVCITNPNLLQNITTILVVVVDVLTKMVYFISCTVTPPKHMTQTFLSLSISFNSEDFSIVSFNIIHGQIWEVVFCVLDVGPQVLSVCDPIQIVGSE